MGRRRTRTSRWPEPRAHLSIPRHLRTARKPVQLTPWRTRQQQSAFSWYLSTKRIYDERVCSPAIEFELGRETVTFHQITSRCPRYFALHSRSPSTPAPRAPPVADARRTCALPRAVGERQDRRRSSEAEHWPRPRRLGAASLTTGPSVGPEHGDQIAPSGDPTERCGDH